MRTIDRPTAHKQLVSKHQTMRWVTTNGSLSVRKTAGRYVVRLEDYNNHSVTTKSFATLAGALVCAEGLRAYYL